MDIGHLWYALGWASFGAAHSILAAHPVRARFGTRFGRRAGRYYRIFYNAFAVLHLGALVWLGRGWLPGSPFDLPMAVRAAGDGVAFAGLVLGIGALTRYDLGRFLGVAQLRDPQGAQDADAVAEPLRIDGLHRYVRHPLYSGLFLVLWGTAQDDFGLATAVWGSLYLLIGSRFEERRLIALYGGAYEAYRRAVPAFVPWRGRVSVS